MITLTDRKDTPKFEVLLSEVELGENKGTRVNNGRYVICELFTDYLLPLELESKVNFSLEFIAFSLILWSLR